MKEKKQDENIVDTIIGFDNLPYPPFSEAISDVLSLA